MTACVPQPQRDSVHERGRLLDHVDEFHLEASFLGPGPHLKASCRRTGNFCVQDEV